MRHAGHFSLLPRQRGGADRGRSTSSLPLRKSALLARSMIPGFPKNAVAYCLREVGAQVKDIDLVAFYDKPLLKFERLLETYLAFAPRGFRAAWQSRSGWRKSCS